MLAPVGVLVLVLVLVPVLVLVLMLVPILALVLGTSRSATQDTTNGTCRSTHSQAGDEHLDIGPTRGVGFGHGVKGLLSFGDSTHRRSRLGNGEFLKTKKGPGAGNQMMSNSPN